MAKKKLMARNPLGQREAIAPEVIRPTSLAVPVDTETKQQGNKETNCQSIPAISLTNEAEQSTPILKRYATYLRPDSIKRIQYEAIDKDWKDYEVVQAIIDAHYEQAS
ncbi:MAG TPA: hypothetical protein VFV38_11890 [Ktedonobacteraceae bacterium]|nr:hypothetical protein [Ktedonobacteraceae bacterium]